jgi:isoleucyl-tRNA synthetase
MFGALMRSRSAVGAKTRTLPGHCPVPLARPTLLCRWLSVSATTGDRAAGTSYSHTLLLPSTPYPLRPAGGAVALESRTRLRITDTLYAWQASAASDSIRGALKGVDPAARLFSPVDANAAALAADGDAAAAADAATGAWTGEFTESEGELVTLDVAAAAAATAASDAGAAGTAAAALKRSRRSLRSFVLHDGPPFANGPLHTGHFLNKTLKDIFNRYKLLRGYRVRFYPGWDCHGMPIELRALNALRASAAPVSAAPLAASGAAPAAAVPATATSTAASAVPGASLTAVQVRTLASDFAAAAMENQQADMRAWGLLGDYDRRYVTMHAGFEARELDVFLALVQRGLIFRQLLPVHWSPSSRTALAESELEYDTLSSTAVHVAFPLARASPAFAAALAAVNSSSGGGVSAARSLTPADCAVLAWTTTPWTLPANRAIAFAPGAEYTVVRAQPVDAAPVAAVAAATAGDAAAAPAPAPAAEPRFFIVAVDTVPALRAALCGEAAPDATPAQARATRAAAKWVSVEPVGAPFPGAALAGCWYRHPLADALPYVGGANARQAADAAAAAAEAAAGAGAPAVASPAECEPPGVMPLIPGGHVTTESGTGLVHTAPGHGVDDYHAAQAYNDSSSSSKDDGSDAGHRFHRIEVACPVGEDGTFTADAGADLAGLSVLDAGNYKCLSLLAGSGALVHKAKLSHRYPLDWRTKQPVIFRATHQWFCALDGVRESALAALDSVSIVPPAGRARLTAFVSGRKQWCISRQRSWGTPIPVFYHRETREPLLTAETVAHVRDVVAVHGTSAWWALPAAELLPPRFRGTRAPDGSYPDCEWEAGRDTMDVWLDSGSSWFAALGARGVARPADLYLEGSDQHRGWFQSSLLTSAAVRGAAPYKAIYSHGFVLDEDGQKMSKSLGNGVEPNVLINGPERLKMDITAGKTKVDALYRKFSTGVGVDALRVWCAAVDATQDVPMGPAVLTLAVDTVRKLRALTRFILGSLEAAHAPATPAVVAAGDLSEAAAAEEDETSELLLAFDPVRDAAAPAELSALDRYTLLQLAQLQAAVTEAYEARNLVRVFTLTRNFMVTNFSALYADACKDRLYADAADSASRRACATVLTHVLETLLKVFAPIAPHLTDDVFVRLPLAYRRAFALDTGATAAAAAANAATAGFSPFSVFSAGWFSSLPAGYAADVPLAASVEAALAVRGAVNVALERARAAAPVAATAAATAAPAEGAGAGAAGETKAGKRAAKKKAAAAVAAADPSAAAAVVEPAPAATAAVAAAAASGPRIRSSLEADVCVTVELPSSTTAAAAAGDADAARALYSALTAQLDELPTLFIVSSVTVTLAPAPAASAPAAPSADTGAGADEMVVYSDNVTVPTTLVPSNVSAAFTGGSSGAPPPAAATARVTVSVRRHNGAKCPRCWRFHARASTTAPAFASASASAPVSSACESVLSSLHNPELCSRCFDVTQGLAQ